MKAVYIPVGATGHVLSSLPMVSALCARGVSVLYFAPERYRAAVEGTGASFCPMPAIAAGGSSVAAGDDFLANLPMVFLGEAKGVIGTVMPACEAFAPDFVIADEMALAGRLVAAKLALPLVMTFTSYAPCEKFSICRFWPTYPDTHPARLAAAALAREFTRDYGVKHLDLYEIFEGLGDYNVSTLTREFQPEGDSFGENFFFAGAQIAARADACAFTPPADGKPLIYTSLGSLFTNWPGFYEVLFPVVRRMDVHVVCALGRQLRPEDLGDIPPNVTLMPFAPQLDILPHASCFITHAGTGSAMESLYFGVPTICVPQMEEQQLTAGRLMNAGSASAVILRHNFTEQALGEALERALHDEALLRRTREASERTRAVSGGDRAAEAILEFVTRR